MPDSHSGRFSRESKSDDERDYRIGPPPVEIRIGDECEQSDEGQHSGGERKDSIAM
jgi:hypothetical protein